LKVLLTIVILGFALSGFFFLQPFQAVLWLLFWIVSYPVALAFTTGESLKGAEMVEIYKQGLTQVPVVGQIFAAWSAKTSDKKSVEKGKIDAKESGPENPSSRQN
jgi:hypothetical protein